MELHQAMRTTFAAREFTDDPLPDPVLYRILDHARFAPSGGNRQGWRVIVVRDAEVRRRLRDLVLPVMRRYLAQVRAGESPYNSVVPSRVTDGAAAALELPPQAFDVIVRAPVLLVIGVDLRVVASFDAGLGRVGVISGASIYPFAWNVLLAARAEGYGGALTTYLAPAEREVQRLLGLPEHVAVAAALPLGRPRQQLTRLRRNPVESFARLERFDGPELRPGSGLP
jgi:nitroreductase